MVIRAAELLQRFLVGFWAGLSTLSQVFPAFPNYRQTEVPALLGYEDIAVVWMQAAACLWVAAPGSGSWYRLPV